MAEVGIIGGGTFGTALARMLCLSGNKIEIWARHPEQLAGGTHPNLPGVEIPREIRVTGNLEEICRGKDLLLIALPSVAIRETAAKIRPFLPENQILVCVAKGLERGTGLTMSGILREELESRNPRLVALSGPTHAEEIAAGLPTAIVAAGQDAEAVRFVQDVCMNTCMRVYTGGDIAGVELSGALKNIIALGCGIANGLGVGDNGKAAMITRGMVEIARLGLAMGCREETFYGLAGIGDLIVTATSMHSRNYRAGLLIGQGISPEQVQAQIGMVVEGLNALPAAMEFSQKYGVELPIISAVNSIVQGKRTPRAALEYLMNRDKTAERVSPKDRRERES